MRTTNSHLWAQRIWNVLQFGEAQGVSTEGDMQVGLKVGGGGSGFSWSRDKGGKGHKRQKAQYEQKLNGRQFTTN